MCPSCSNSLCTPSHILLIYKVQLSMPQQQRKSRHGRSGHFKGVAFSAAAATGRVQENTRDTTQVHMPYLKAVPHNNK